MEDFITECLECKSAMRVRVANPSSAHEKVRCPRCQTVQKVAVPWTKEPTPVSSTPKLEWIERKAIWILAPLTLWLAWTLGKSPPRSEETRKEVDLAISRKLRIPLRMWKSFEAEDHSFSVRIPGTPQVAQSPNDAQTKTWNVVFEQAPGGDGSLAFQLTSFRIGKTEQMRKFQSTLHWFTCLQSQDFPDMQRCHVRPIRKAGADGGEYFIELGDSQMTRLAILNGTTAYYVTCTGSNLNAYLDDWRYFLDSFEIHQPIKAAPELRPFPK